MGGGTEEEAVVKLSEASHEQQPLKAFINHRIQPVFLFAVPNVSIASTGTSNFKSIWRFSPDSPDDTLC